MPLAAAVAAIAVLGGLGALVDKAAGHDVLVLFTVGLCVGTAVAVLLVQRLHLFASVVAIPLAWVVLVFLGAVVAPGDRFIVTFGIDFTLKAPAVLISTGIGVVLALGRKLLQPQN